MPLLACRVGRHNLIRKDKSSDPYGDFGGSGDEEENLDDQNFGDYEESARRAGLQHCADYLADRDEVIC